MFHSRQLIRYRQLGDYSVAASYFRQLAPFYAKDEWTNLELLMLNMYADCLSHLKRTEDYVHVASETLAKVIRRSSEATKDRSAHSARLLETSKTLSYMIVSLKNILAASASLERPISIQMDRYFDNIRLDHPIHHCSDHDGFTLLLKLRSLLPDSFEVQSLRVKLIAVAEEQHSELWVSSEGVQTIRPGFNKIVITSKVSISQASYGFLVS